MALVGIWVGEKINVVEIVLMGFDDGFDLFHVEKRMAF